MSAEGVLSNRVKVSRIARNWSQEELARRSGVSRTGISAIEVGRLVPSVATALSIAEALGCRVELGVVGASRTDSVLALQV
jgi:DNA-binding XRE family transcriptional regulator